MRVTHNYPYEGNTLPGHITQDEKLDLIMFASVENMIQIHVYTYSKHGKCHFSKCGIYTHVCYGCKHVFASYLPHWQT